VVSIAPSSSRNVDAPQILRGELDVLDGELSEPVSRTEGCTHVAQWPSVYWPTALVTVAYV